MSLYNCPKCNEKAFTWWINEEVSPLTNWSCGECRYVAREDETLERVCSACREKAELQLEDDAKTYWWCCRCNSIKEEI